jgi:hypothetical protein
VAGARDLLGSGAAGGIWPAVRLCRYWMGTQGLMGSVAAGAVRTTVRRKDDWPATQDPADHKRQGRMWAGVWN